MNVAAIGSGLSLNLARNIDAAQLLVEFDCYHAGPREPGFRGSQYASPACRIAGAFGMQVSMSRRANAWGNAPMESFFKTLMVGYDSRRRLHTSIDYLAPVDDETRRMAAGVAVCGAEAGSVERQLCRRVPQLRQAAASRGRGPAAQHRSSPLPTFF
ncbi:transposase [Cupriavidus necator]|uniref:transposase n=1 Tax=Cupriavidus necator TaxID=106590 RepID=UPI000674A4A4